MKTTTVAAILLLLAVVPSAPALGTEGAASSLHLGLLPASAMIHPWVDDSPTGGIQLANGSWTPTLLVGWEYDRGGGFGLDAFLAGLVQPHIEGWFYGANLSYILPHSAGSLLRGRLIGGVMMTSLHEDNPADANFEESPGWQAGIGLDLGRERFNPLVVELLYRSMVIDIEPDPRFLSSVNLSGFSLNIGFKYNFR